MSLFSFFTPKDKETVLILDIGSASVGGAFVRFPNNQCPHILASIRHDMATSEDLTFERFLSETSKTLQRVLTELHKANPVHPSKIFCVLASPWHTSQTRLLSYTDTKDFTINEALVKTVIGKEIERFKKEVLESRRAVTQEENDLIEVTHMTMRVNGYETPKPYGKIGHSIELSTFMSVGSKKGLARFADDIARMFHREDVSFHTFLFTGFNAIRNSTNKQTFLFIDINGEITDVAIVRDNFIAESASFPSGKNTILRAIATSFSTSLDGAKSLLRSYNDRKLHGDAMVQFDRVIDEARTAWVAELRRVIEIISPDFLLPDTAYVAAGSHVAPLVKIFLGHEDFSALTITNKPLDVITLEPTMFKDHCVFDAGLRPDLFLLLDAIFIDQYIREKKHL